MTPRLQMPTFRLQPLIVMFKRYYLRVIGFFLFFGGIGVILEELFNIGLIQLGIIEHEFYGLVSIIIGFILIGLGGKGKQ